MNVPQQDDSQPTVDQTELLLRVSRRGLLTVLMTILLLGGTMLGMALWPSSVLASWPSRLPWLLPMVLFLALIGLHAPLRGRRWNPSSPEVKAVLEDEFRRTNMARAQRAAFMVVLIAQVPLALLLMSLPAMQAVLAMAVATITLGMVMLIALFLFFDRG